MKRSIESVYHKLIVSCQALPEEPLHSSFIMGRMAVAAKEGGAGGIRANSVEDIKEIQKNVDLPIIGIIKRDYPGYAVRITQTIREVDELMQVEPDVIAVDATCRVRPDGKRIEEFYAEIREKYPQDVECVLDIAAFLKQRYGYTLSEEEILYLSIHVSRIHQVSVKGGEAV